MSRTAQELLPSVADDDLALVRRALARDPSAFRLIMTRHNQRLYRLARSILSDGDEAEDALQEAYMRAFASLDGFRGESALATWLSRIVINEAFGRLRKRRRGAARLALAGQLQPTAEVIPFPSGAVSDDPERSMAQRQILQFVEQATDRLPEPYRMVFIARAVEGLSQEETAELLGIKPETVKTRLHRARKLLRERLDEQIGPVLLDAFPFAGRRCERLTEAVMQRLGLADR
jgi:RNA polymerase sigma-70 factor (ECF subfamily)